VDTTKPDEVRTLKVVSAKEYKAELEDSYRASHLQRDMRYICVEASGYHSGGFSRESAPTRALSRLKQFLVLAKAAQVLDTTWRPSEDVPPDVAMLATSFEGSWRSLQVEKPQWEAIAQYGFSKTAFQRSGFLALLMGANPENGIPEGEWAQHLGSSLKNVATAIDAASSNKAAERLCTCGEWLFDSEAERNQTVAFLYACIGFEALLGEDERHGSGEMSDVGVTAMLADRVSFLTGGGREKREEIRKQFRLFYGARSKVVHGRVPRLDPDDARLLHWGRRTLYQCVSAELQHV